MDHKLVVLSPILGKGPLPRLSVIPTERNMLSYSMRTDGDYPRTSHIVVFEYPDCTREFDGKTWRIVQDKRQQPHPGDWM